MQLQQVALMDSAVIDAEAGSFAPHSFGTFAHLLTRAAELSEKPEGASGNREGGQPSPGKRSGDCNKGSPC